MGVGTCLRELGKTVCPVVPDRFPEYLGFLDRSGLVRIYDREPEAVQRDVEGTDLIICLDFNSLSRIGALGELIGAAAAPRVLIDHHPAPEPLFDLAFSRTDVSSTCEVACGIMRELMPGRRISPESARAFYTGMMTDTNNFANSVWPSTFRLAADLLEAGVDKEKIQRAVFSQFKEERMRLMGYMLYENMKIFPQYRTGLMVLTREIQERFRYENGDSEGLVNLALNIATVDISALLTEGEEFVRVSLRSREGISVNRLCRRYFNGGGHEQAAGGRLYLPAAGAEEYFLKSVAEFLADEKQAYLL